MTNKRKEAWIKSIAFALIYAFTITCVYFFTSWEYSLDMFYWHAGISVSYFMIEMHISR